MIPEATNSPQTTQEQTISVLLDNIKVGDYITFGTYEQDNDLTNGKEDIEWLVLAKDGSKALVISKYALDCQQYNTSNAKVTWETCFLRKWLNETFLNEAFSENERTMIPGVTVSADKNPSYSTDPGNSTKDQVFLLSIREANEYFSSDNARQCQGTAYCYAHGAYKAHGVYKANNGNCWWWLRSPGLNSISSAASVSTDGSVSDYGFYVYDDNVAVRPTLWVNLDKTNGSSSGAENKENIQTVGKNIQSKNDTIREGTCVTFGSYEQDNDSTNGKEPIGWLVLTQKENRMLLLSKYGLDVQPYNSSKGAISWDRASIRSWLNNTFLPSAFSAEEQNRILQTDVKTQYQSTITQDKVFLISAEELEDYHVSDEDRQCIATDYAIYQGANVSEDLISRWWLRSEYSGSGRVSQVNVAGKVNINWNYANTANIVVRPAIWVNKYKNAYESIQQRQEDFNRKTQEEQEQIRQENLAGLAENVQGAAEDMAQTREEW